MKYYLLLVLFSISSPLYAGRTIIPPAYFWHDWIKYTQPWCPNAGGVYEKSIEFVITNISTIDQNIRIETSGIATEFSMWSSVGSAGGVGTYIDKDKKTDNSMTLSSKQSKKISVSYAYKGPAAAGDWHILGAVNLQITVAEDRGAVTGSYTTVSDNSCGPIDETQTFGMMRDNSKVFLINGGRPF